MLVVCRSCEDRQSLSMGLHQNAAVAANVEAWISELGDFAQGPSSLPLRDAIAWEVIARLDESRNIDQAVQQVCPDLCADQTRRSALLNAVHKNLRQLVCMGAYLSTYAVPSASMLGAAKKKRKGGKKSRQDPDASQDPASQLDNPDGQCERPEDTDKSDCSSLLGEACDAERRDAFERGELDIEDEFHMDSASIADAAHSASTEVQWTMLSGAPSFINGGCGQSTGTGGAPSFVNGGCGQSTVTASQLGLREFTQRHGADSASKHPANTEERRAHALRQQCPHATSSGQQKPNHWKFDTTSGH